MASSPTPKRVLFVDDEASIRLTLPPILEKAGFEVHVAESVPDALFEINSYQFDALITDLNIGEEGDGFLVASGMRHIQPNCKTFILTGYPAFETALQAIHSQVDDYLVKPVEVDSLIGCLKDKIGVRLAKAPLVPKRIPTLLKDSTSQIVAQSVAAIQGNGKRRSGPLSSDTMNRFVESFVGALAEQMQREEETLRPAALQAALEYGQLKKKSGAPASEIASDFRSIEDAAFRVIQGGVTSGELLTLLSDLRRFSRGVNLLVEEALQGFAPARE